MGIEPNITVIKGRRGVSVDVGGVKMAGVLNVRSDLSHEGGSVTIEVHSLMVRFDQRHDDVDDALVAIERDVAQIRGLQQKARMERDAARQTQQARDVAERDARLVAAKKPRVRVKARK